MTLCVCVCVHAHGVCVCVCVHAHGVCVCMCVHARSVYAFISKYIKIYPIYNGHVENINIMRNFPSQN